MIGEGDCGAVGGMKIGRGNRSTWRKPAPVPLCPPQIPLEQTRLLALVLVLLFMLVFVLILVLVLLLMLEFVLLLQGWVLALVVILLVLISMLFCWRCSRFDTTLAVHRSYVCCQSSFKSAV
jgi:membrane glycosyltransferase